MDDIRTNPTLNEKVIDGRLRNLAPDRPVVAIGVRLAEALGATVGSSISLISPQGQVTPFGTAPRIVSYEVGAIFEVGVYDYDKAFVIMQTEQAKTPLMLGAEEIGRASGRESGCQYVWISVVGSILKKKEYETIT